MNRYPLTWPAGWPRMKARKSANFKRQERTYSTLPGGGSSFYSTSKQLTIADAVGRLLDEMRKLGVQEGDSIISTNLQVRLDGLPRSGQPEPQDPGVAVYWERPGDKGTKVMAIDIYDRVADNIAAVAATLDAMRAIERHGGAQILERAFTGFDALPAPGQTSRNWRNVLELDGESSIEAARTAYRRLSSLRHPDKPGGSHDAMSELNSAWAQAQEALGA